VATGQCVGCRADGDCAAAERCKDGECLLFVACLADDDCPGSRLCQQGACVAEPGCEGDRFDDMEAPVTVPLWDTTGLVLCDGTVDRYELELPAGVGVTVMAVPAPGAVGDLRLEVYSTPAPGQGLGNSDHPWGPERVSLPAQDVERTVALVVSGRAGDTTPYSLRLDPLGPDDCAPDAAEGLWDNDEPGRATPLMGSSTRTLRLCGGDVDWLSLELAVGLRARVTARSLAGAQDLTLAAYADPDAEAIQESGPGAGAEVAFTAQTNGAHYLRLASAGDQAATVELSVVVQADDDALALACADPLALTPDAPTPLPPAPNVNRFQLSCRQGMGADHVLSFDLALPGRARFRVDGVQQGSALSVREDCVDGPELLCAALGPDEVSAPVDLLPGTYHVLVKTDGAVAPQVHLDLSAACVADFTCGPGELCQGSLCLPACAGAEDCGPGQSCEAGTGRCLEPDVCAADPECVGLRRCDPQGRCFLPECQVNGDCPAACVDQRCADGPPVECNGDGDCGPGTVCAAAGVCVRTEPCVQDADCGPGAPVCHGPSGECRACVADGDCAAAEQCWQGRCSYLGFCDAPGDCPGDRSCEAGRCVPAACADDRMESEPPTTLVARTYTGLVLCDGDLDRYRVQAAAGQGLRITLRHDPAEGDLTLELRTGAGSGELLDSSDGLAGVEVVGVPAAVEAQDLQLYVTGRAGASLQYSLSVTALDPGQCPPDGLEGVLGNDSPERAAKVGTGTRWLRICPDDEDWLELTLTAGARLAARALPDAAAPELEMELHGPEGNLPTVALPEGEPPEPGAPVALVLQADASTFGPHRLRLHAPAAPAPVWLLLNLTAEAAPDAVSLACEDVPTLLPGESTPLPAAVPVDRFDTDCALGRGEEHLLTFELAEAAAVTLRVWGNRNPIGVALRSSCSSAGTEVACGLDMETPLQDVLLEAGEYTAIVETRGETEPEIILDVQD